MRVNPGGQITSKASVSGFKKPENQRKTEKIKENTVINQKNFQKGIDKSDFLWYTLLRCMRIFKYGGKHLCPLIWQRKKMLTANGML